MLFTSLSFLILVSATFVLYYAVARQELQAAIRIAASFIFYAAGQPALLLLLLACVALNAVVSYAIGNTASDRTARRTMSGIALAPARWPKQAISNHSVCNSC